MPAAFSPRAHARTRRKVAVYQCAIGSACRAFNVGDFLTNPPGLPLACELQSPCSLWAILRIPGARFLNARIPMLRIESVTFDCPTLLENTPCRSRNYLQPTA